MLLRPEPLRAQAKGINGQMSDQLRWYSRLIML